MKPVISDSSVMNHAPHGIYNIAPMETEIDKTKNKTRDSTDHVQLLNNSALLSVSDASRPRDQDRDYWWRLLCVLLSVFYLMLAPIILINGILISGYESLSLMLITTGLGNILLSMAILLQAYMYEDDLTSYYGYVWLEALSMFFILLGILIETRYLWTDIAISLAIYDHSPFLMGYSIFLFICVIKMMVRPPGI